MKSLKERWKQESLQMYGPKPDEETQKSFRIFKTDEDKRLVFGWASIAITVTGEALEDRQHDVIEPEDLEEAAYEYVLNFRDTGEEHLPGYRKKGKLVESCVFTPEKQKAMGIPEGTLPVGWWIGFKIDDDDTWQRVKNGTYRMFSIEGKAQREEIEKSERTARSFEEVLKFNPFHDAMGKFSTAQGMNTYSANPKTKAGQLAIGRSAPNHAHVMNVHRESKGENIGQNYKWIETGQKPTSPPAQGQNPAPKKPKTTNKPKTQAKPKNTVNDAQDGSQTESSTTLAESVANVKLTPNRKLALQARNEWGNPTETKKVAEDHYQDRVAGTDISKTFDYYKMKTNKDPIDAIAEAQGWNKGATITNDRDLFDKACIQSGRVMMRSVDGYGGKQPSEVCNGTMTDGDMPLGGHGGKSYGTGMYLVDTNLKGGVKASDISAGQFESYCYGSTQMMATLHPNAKIATSSQAAAMADEFWNMSNKDQERFGYDRNTYIASKGYDGVKWHSDDDPTAYTTLFNKSALIFYGGTAYAY